MGSFLGPPEDRVRCHECRDLREQPPTKPVTQYGEAPAIAVVEPQAVPSKPGLQNTIFLPQERDDVCLLTMEPGPKTAISN
jgi:hypothetical protein